MSLRRKFKHIHSTSTDPSPSSKILLLLGFLLTAVGATALIQSIPTLEWTATRGIVLESRDIPTPHLTYAYQVNEVLYISSELSHAPLQGDLAIRQWTERYFKGDSLPLFYDPTNPEKAVLSRRGIGKGSLILLLGFVSMGYGVWVGRRR